MTTTAMGDTITAVTISTSLKLLPALRCRQMIGQPSACITGYTKLEK